MLDTIGAFGSGIGTNLLSDSLSKKLEAFKDKKAIASFTQSLRDWEIEFEKQNDGTIITNGAFYSHVKYHNVIENIVAYVLEPSMNAVTEDEFLNCLHEKMVNRIEETTEKKLSWNDSRLIRNFLTHLLTTTRAFLFQKISLEDRGLFYLVCQNNAKLEHLERIVKEKFQMQDQNVQQIVEQLSMAIQKSETEERIKAKMASWNSRQIKNLGNRYTPDLNIPVEIMDSLHGASVDQQFQNIFYDKVDKFLIAMRHTELSEINALCDAIEKYAIELNFFNITSSDIDVIISTVNAIKDFLTSKIEEYYENPEGKKNFDSKAYQLYEKLGIANEFNDYLTNTTVRVAVSPYIILAGDGGVGKSHLIADYIDNCDSLGQTSLLLLGQQFSAGMDVLAIELWWKLNEELAALCGVLRRYAVFRLLLDESEDAFFSVIREVTEQFDLFPKEEHAPSEEMQRKRLERVANEISARSETVKDAPLDLFHPSEAASEKGDAFYYEMLRAIGPTKDAWRDYKKYIRRYETYLHDIRAFNGTIRNFISFSLSKLKHNSPEDYAAALYGFYNDERIAEKLIVNPIRNNGDCYTTHDAYELSYVPRPLPDGSVAICQEHVTDSLQALMKADYIKRHFSPKKIVLIAAYTYQVSDFNFVWAQSRIEFFHSSLFQNLQLLIKKEALLAKMQSHTLEKRTF